METINSMVKHGNEISVISARFWTAARTRTHSCKCGGGSGYEVFSNVLALSWEHNFSVKLSQRLQWWQTLEVPHWASFKVARSKCTDDGESTRWGCCEGRGNLWEPSSEHSGFFLRCPHHTMTMLICAFGPLLPFSISSHSWHCGSADTSLRKMPNEETSLKHFLLGFFFFFASTSPPPFNYFHLLGNPCFCRGPLGSRKWCDVKRLRQSPIGHARAHTQRLRKWFDNSQMGHFANSNNISKAANPTSHPLNPPNTFFCVLA